MQVVAHLSGPSTELDAVERNAFQSELSSVGENSCATTYRLCPMAMGQRALELYGGSEFQPFYM